MNISQNNKRIKLKVVGSHDESFFFFKERKKRENGKKNQSKKTPGGKKWIKNIKK